MAQFDVKRLRAHGERLHEAGYRRRSIYLSPALSHWLETNRQQNETLGATIERMMGLQRGAHPPYDDTAEARREERAFRKRIRRAENELAHSRRAANWGGSVVLSITLHRKDRKSGVVVTSAGVYEFEGESPP
ncbi:hypothetical protein VSR34_09675 [Paraburkholderia sp. JHI2823]|uniref:hypothetical protein n=1 Tax=Paraburkholderia sp. JHI2823 TaxID=3112960 RepID=UPI0031816502